MTVRDNKYPSIWQIVDTYRVRKLQNNGNAPTRLLVSMQLAQRLYHELIAELVYPSRPVIGQCTDFLGMGVRIVADSSIEGEFEIDHVPVEHKPYDRERRYGSHFHFSFDDSEFWKEWSFFTNQSKRW